MVKFINKNNIKLMDSELTEINKRFSFWARFYDFTWLPLFNLRRKSLRFIAVKPKEQILDLACGTGDIAINLNKQGAIVTASDLSQAMIKQAQKKDVQKQIKFIVCDSSKFNTDNKFDKIIISFSLHEMPLIIAKQTLVNCLKFLKSDGQLIIIDFFKGSGLLYFFGNIFLKIFECKYYSDFIKFDLNNYLSANNFVCQQQEKMLFNLCCMYKYQKKYDRK